MYETRPLDLSPAGLAACAALIREVMPRGTHITAEFLDWQYNRNPDGHAFGFNAYDGPRLVSHCVVQPLRAGLFGEEQRGVLSLNAVSHPSCRGKGVYFDLAARTYDLARADGYAFGVAVTNDFSTSGFVRNVGFSVVGPLQARLGIGPVARRDIEVPVDLKKSWRPESVAWRLSPPGGSYRLVRTADGVSARGRMVGWPVDVLLGELAPELCEGLTGSEAGSTGAVRLWVGLDARVAWSRSAYLDLPMKVRPSPLYLIFLDLGGQGRTLDPARVHWRALDFDTF